MKKYINDEIAKSEEERKSLNKESQMYAYHTIRIATLKDVLNKIKLINQQQ